MPSLRPDHTLDDRMMARAAFLAERGRGQTHPNPMVGAVVVSDSGVVVGQGAHRQAGGPHAEIHALHMAGAAAQGATLYCTLEPCCHVGRTGPCVERIRAAGIRRVVTAAQDPNPLVAGQGHAWLRQHGITVDTGVGAALVGEQQAPFITWMSARRPWTMLKTAVSADGTVGAPGVRLSGPEADRWMHRQRAWVDAIAVGAGTVLADDPQLTARGAWRARPLIRVVIDWRARVPRAARVYSTLAAGPVIMVCLASAPEPHTQALEAMGVQVVRWPARNLAAVSGYLGQLGVQSLLVEGGPTLHEAWSASGPVDWVQWLATPATQVGGPPVSSALTEWRSRVLSGRRTPLGADELIEGEWR